jgi:large subunit ribosomal protein L24
MRKKPIPFEGKIRVKTGDTVVVLAGKDKGKSGTILRVYRKSGKVIVDGLNLVTKHVRAQPTPTNPNPPGGRVETPAALPISKIALVNAEGKPTRVRVQADDNGTKQRIAVKGGTPIAEPAR